LQADHLSLPNLTQLTQAINLN